VAVTELERFTVPVPGGCVAAVLHLPEADTRVACVVACHGLSASKDSDKYLLLGEALPAAGIALVRFDFRGCGESTGVETETTIATRVEDVRAVIGATGRHGRLTGRLGFLGSSLGGFVALHVVACLGGEPPVVTWNSPVDLRDLERPDEPSGLGAAFYDEVSAGRYASAPAGLRRHLVVQAALDDVVPPAHGARLHAQAAMPRRIVTLAGADHRLGDPEHRRQALAASLAWFREHL
jgi:fermentation-respiration switch protein FrsA (DUF1100 family)